MCLLFIHPRAPNLISLGLPVWTFSPRAIQALFFRVSSRDRIAPNCPIRHPVLPIVALQRRVRFSARFAGFCRIRWHQRRAGRAERASFSVSVSNLDFRVPRLRPNRRTGADRAVRRRKRGRPESPESGPGLPQRSGLARSGPGAPGPPCVLTCLGFGLNQGPAMLEWVLAPSLVSQLGSPSPLRGLVGDREDRVRQPPPE